MKVLITGVAGLLGSKLAEWIITNIPEAKVYGIDDLSGGYKEHIPQQVIFLKKNLVKDTSEVAEIFAQNSFDYVFHLAAYAAEGLSPFIRTYNYDNNLRATALIVNECIKNNIQRLVFTSTMAVYGHPTKGVFDESQVPKPIDPYGVAKYACEMDINIAGEQHGLDWCVIRPHNVYGPNQNIWDKYRNVLGIWMYQHLQNQPMSIFGDGKQTRAFSYIDDILAPLWNAAVLPNASKQVINLGGIREYSINEANETLLSIIEDSTKIHLECRHEVKHAVPTYEKSVEILKFKHCTDLKSGLSKMWDWAQKQPDRGQFMWDSYELEKGIYDFWKK